MDVVPTSISSSKATSRRINAGCVDQRTSDCPGIVRASGFLFLTRLHINVESCGDLWSNILADIVTSDHSSFFSFNGSIERNDKAYFYPALLFDTGVRDCLAPSPCSSLCSSLLHTFPRIISLWGMAISKNRCLQWPLSFLLVKIKERMPIACLLEPTYINPLRPRPH
jgi:hypothetical protein